MAERRPNRTLGAPHDTFWEWCGRGELRLQRCDTCAELCWPAVAQCDNCGSTAFSWERMSGRGTITSWCTFERDYYAGALPLPWTTILVALEEGPFFVSNPGDRLAPEAIRFGLPVTVAFRACQDDAGEFNLPVFEMDEQGSKQGSYGESAMAARDDVETALPPGLTLALDAFSADEEAALLAACEQCALNYYAMDPDNPRSSVSFGWKYEFATDSFVDCAPIPSAFRAVQAIAARLAGCESGDITECVVNRYETGAHIQPHIDKPVFALVIGLSLGAAAGMVFSKPAELGGERHLVTLPRRSIYVMSGEARHVYRHEIPPVAETRWSLTFRTLSPQGERLRAQLAANR